MTARRLAPVLAIAVASLLLSGCTFKANLIVPAASVAKAAADALEGQVGMRPDVDCGKGDVDLVDDTVVDCVVTDPETKGEYDATVRISDVKGTDYRVNVKVADTPREGTGTTPEAPETPDEGANGITHTVTAESVEKLAANALFNEAPPYYTLECGAGDLQISLNAKFDCTATHPDGTVYDAVITVTSVTETNYNIDVVRSGTPR